MSNYLLISHTLKKQNKTKETFGRHVSCVQRENKILLAAQVSPPTCFMSWSGERLPLCFTAAGTGQTPKCVVLHFPSPFSSIKSWVMNYQRKCEPCQCKLRHPAKSPYSTEPRSTSSIILSLSLPSSSQLYLLSLRAPCAALRSSFIYECILLNCVCRRTSQPLPCQWSGTMLLKRLWFSESTGESDPGRSYACLPPADICESALLPAKETHLGDGVKTAPLYRHHHRPLRWIDDFRHKTTRNTLKCVFHVPQNVKLGYWAEKFSIQSPNA